MRLLFPVLNLAILIGLFLFSEGIAARFSKNLEGVAKTYLKYVLLAAIWLSGAHVVTRLIKIVLWNRISKRLLAKEPPRILLFGRNPKRINKIRQDQLFSNCSAW